MAAANVQFEMDPDGVHVLFTHVCADSEAENLHPLPNGKWSVVQREPLTVTPSIHCTMCGCHGFITNGEWVSC